jgi:hypothetical protein
MALVGMVALGCGREAKQGVAAGEPPVASSKGGERAASSATVDLAARPSASGERGEPSTETAAVDVSREESPPDPANKLRPPLTSADLEERAAHLLEAVAKKEPALADDFFFPKAPFIPLKDVADPGRYFDQLLATYHHDVAALHAERKDWSGVAFVSFELGTPPTWVAPGKEYNKIGYFRTFGGKLRYRVSDKTKEINVSTIISWGGRWYVTHLSPIRH